MLKRINVLSWVIMVILSLLASPVLATSVTWQRTGDLRSSSFGGFDIDQVFALEISGGTLFAGTDLGLFISDNGGVNWYQWPDPMYKTLPTTAISVDTGEYYFGTVNGVRGLTSSQVNTLTIDPIGHQTVYAGTSSGGVYKSTDKGTSWIAANSGLTNTYVYALAIDPTSPQTLYAGTRGGGVFKSFNGGISWVATNEGINNATVRALAIDPTSPQTIYAGTFNGGVFKSTNGGISWNAVLTTSPVFSLAIDPTSSQTIYAGTGSAVYRSINGGYSWSQAGYIAGRGYIGSLAIDPINSQTIYAGTSNSLGPASVYKGLYTLDIPTISSAPDTTVTTATIGTAYSFTPSATDASSFVITGSVPPGMTFDTTTGTLSGTPTTAGSYNIAITVINASGSASLPAFTINVAQKPASVPVMGGWWLMPGILAGLGIFARKRK